MYEENSDQKKTDPTSWSKSSFRFLNDFLRDKLFRMAVEGNAVFKSLVYYKLNQYKNKFRN